MRPEVQLFGGVAAGAAWVAMATQWKGEGDATCLVVLREHFPMALLANFMHRQHSAENFRSIIARKRLV
ncbi:hypothetical protein XI06_24840 [Bradyrhizobium sp. CCBAU 11434]|nr:hypothetical protein [Bradyrhizobium sp. CCBAU 11434]